MHGRRESALLLAGDLAGDLPPSRSPSSSTSFACISACCCFCRSFLASCSGRSSNETRIVPTGGGFSILAGSLRWSASASALSDASHQPSASSSWAPPDLFSSYGTLVKTCSTRGAGGGGGEPSGSQSSWRSSRPAAEV